jgi:hypothetical protein
MMSAVIGLSVIGAAYALWFEDLRLLADVRTGTFDVDWSIEDQGGVPIVSLDEGETWTRDIPEGKAPRCESVLGETDTNQDFPSSNDVVSNNRLDLRVFGAYPYAGCSFLIDIHNVGTTPAHIQVIDRGEFECLDLDVDPPGTPDPNNCATENPVVIEVHPGGTQWAGTTPDTCDSSPPGASCPSDLSALAACQALFGSDSPTGSTIEGLQLHTSNELHCRINVTLAQSADAEADRYFVFAADLRAHQWNEAQGGDQ